MGLVLKQAASKVLDDGQIIYTCPFCYSLRSASVNMAVMHHVCNSGTVFLFNGHALKGAGEYNQETRIEVERKRNK